MKGIASIFTLLLVLCFSLELTARRFSYKPRKLHSYTDSLSYTVGVIRAQAGSSQTIHVEGLSKRLAKKGYSEATKGRRWRAMSEFALYTCFSRYIINNNMHLISGYQAEAARFLEKNAKKSGVISDYSVQLKVGSRWGEAIKQTDRVTISYSVSNINGALLEFGREDNVYLDQLATILHLPYADDLGDLQYVISHIYTPGTHGASYTFYVPQYIWNLGDKPYMVLVYDVDIFLASE